MAIANWALRQAGYQDPSRNAMKDLDQIPGQINPYYKPYSEAGQRQIGNLESQYGQMTNDPGGMVNKIGGNYQQSPGFKFALQQALQGSGHAAAAGGMAGSPQHEQQNMGIATNLANQDYNTWLQHALGLYGSGVQGEQDLMHEGYGAGNEYAQSTGNNLQSKANLKFGGAQSQNQMIADIMKAGASVVGGRAQ